MSLLKFIKRITVVLTLTLAGLFLFIRLSSAQPGSYEDKVHVDFEDYNNWSGQNLFNGDRGNFEASDGSACKLTFVSDPGETYGGSGNSLKLDYDAKSWSGMWSSLKGANLQKYNAVSFWVKGSEGGENFQVGLKDAFANEDKVDITSYLSGGVTKSWQEVTIPFQALADVKHWENMDSFSVTFLPSLDAKGIIFMDYIIFVNTLANDAIPPEPPQILTPQKHQVRAGRVDFEWFASDDGGVAGRGIEGYSYILDKFSDTEVDRKIDGVVAHKTYVLSEGIFYFHIAAMDNAGNWSATAHFDLKVSSPLMLIDDFDDGDSNNSLNEGTWAVSPTAPNYCNPAPVDDPALVHGGSGQSLQLDYGVSGEDNWVGYWTKFSFWISDAEPVFFRDISLYQSLTFWVKGDKGGESFNIGFKDGNEKVWEININDYLTGGVTGSWQKVSIPLYAFWGISDWSKIDTMSIVFNDAIKSGAGKIYIDDIELTADYVLHDNFDAAKPPDDPGTEEPESSYQVYGANGAAPPKVEYDSSGAFGLSGNSLKLTYDVPGIGTAESIWQLNFGKIDISNLSTLSFYAKGENGGECFEIHMKSANGNKGVVGITDYLTLQKDRPDAEIASLREGWRNVRIPLLDFQNQGVDLSEVECLEIYFKPTWAGSSYVRNRGTVYIDNIEFTNDLYKEPSTGPVQVCGQDLLLNGKPFTIQGVGYQPTPIGLKPYGSDYDSIDVFADTEYNRLMWERDFNYLKEISCNAIRTWARITSAAFLDACYQNGIYVIMGYWVNIGQDLSKPENRMPIIDDFAQYVNAYKDHPAVLMWAIGNEDNYYYNRGPKGWFPNENRADVVRDYYILINELARTAYEIEGPHYHPVIFPNGELYYVGRDDARASDEAMNYLDVWGSNVYRGSSFGEFFTDYQSRSSKPLLITEYGADAWDQRKSQENQDAQASQIISLWNEIMLNSNICVGGTIMAYSDEWWKGHDLNSQTSYGQPRNDQPDGFANEAWWGIMQIVDHDNNPNTPDIMVPRQIYYILQGSQAPESTTYSFNDGIDPKEKIKDYTNNESQHCAHFIYSENPDNVWGGAGCSMQIQWSLSGEGAWGATVFSLDGFDARLYHTLSFWVKGSEGGEIFKVGLKDAYTIAGNEPKVLINDYLPLGVTKDWQKVSIPLAAFTTISSPDNLESFVIAFEKVLGDVSGIIYIDEVQFEKEMGALFIDYFNDGVNGNALVGSTQKSIWTIDEDNPGARINIGYDDIDPYGGTGLSYYIDYALERPEVSCCIWKTELKGVNAAYKDTLSFYIKGKNGGERTNVYLSDGHNRAFARIENYVTVSTEWQRVAIPLFAFSSQGVDLSNLQSLELVFEWEKMSGTIYLDNIEFVSYRELIMPTVNEVPKTTNAVVLKLFGNKARGTSVIINDKIIAQISDETEWSYEYPLVKGVNIITLFARNYQGYESGKIVIVVEADPDMKFIAPPAQNVRVLNDPDNFGRNDSTINVTVLEYPVGNMKHTGYMVEISDNDAFDSDYVVYYYWHPCTEPEKAVPIEADVSFDIDLGLFVGADDDDVWADLPDEVYVRLMATRYEFKPSEFDGVKRVSLSPRILLEPPKSLMLSNDDGDSSVLVVLNPRAYSERRPGAVVETGYRIDFLPGNKDFETAAWDEMHHEFRFYDKQGDGVYDEVSADELRFEIDLRYIESSMFMQMTINGVKARVSSIRGGFTTSDMISADAVPVGYITRLENPPSSNIVVSNNDGDRVITVAVTHYNPLYYGLKPPSGAANWKDTSHTGYRIDISKDRAFAWDRTFYYYYKFDFDKDGEPDEIRNFRGEASIDVDLNLARDVLGNDFISSGGKVYVKVLAIREGYSLNFESLNTFEVSFNNVTRLENPGTHARVYNTEAGNPFYEIGRSITVEIENYDPSGTASGNNLKNSPHTGYRIDISIDKDFNSDRSFTYYYQYDPDGNGVPNEINSHILESIKIDFDLDSIRPLWQDEYSRLRIPQVYVRIFAIRNSYVLNYEDLPTFSVPFVDRTLPLAPPSSVKASNPVNANSGNDIDSSILVVIDKTIPGEICHDGYDINIGITGADGKTYYRTFSVTGLEPGGDGYIPEVRRTIDIIGLFEKEARDLLEGYIGIPADGIAHVIVIAESTKEGYPNSIPIEANYASGALEFKNKSTSFLPKIADLKVSSLAGTATVVVEVGPYPYPGIPSTAPEGPVVYEVDFSTDKRFEKNLKTVHVDSYPINLQMDVSDILKISSDTLVCIRARLLKDGYTPGSYSKRYEVTVDKVPPKIVGFTASPMFGKAPLTVDFRSDCTGSITKFKWYFGDGSEANVSSPKYVYKNKGMYTVTLVVEGPCGTDTMRKEYYIHVGNTIVQMAGDLQANIDSASSGDFIAIPNGTYTGSVTINKYVTLIGESPYDTVIEGEIILEDASASIENITITSGIIAKNSEIDVKNCIIHGGIDIWTLAGSIDISPTIKNNLILDGGIYLYSQDNGGAISGAISNNTFDGAGIVMRMHKECPAIYNNIITGAGDAIYLTYGSSNMQRIDGVLQNIYGSLLNERLGNITNNCFFGNSHSVWCEELQAEQVKLLWDPAGNINKDPEFTNPEGLDYTPQNPACEGIGCSLP